MESRRTASRQQRNARSQPGTKVALQFVNVVPGQDQKTKTRSIIRANAAHFHWRFNRPSQDKSEFNKKSSRHVARASSRAEISSRVPDHGAADGIDQLQSSSPSYMKHGAIYDHDENNSGTLSLMKTQIGFDVIDPFASYECGLPRDFVSRCITFNARFILPALFPDAADNFKIRASMLQLSTTNSFMMHMFITGALINSQENLKIIPRSIALDMFRSRNDIVRRMSIIMSDPVEACEDINILAIATLAKVGRVEKVDVPLKTPKQGPLRSLQFMNSFALTETDLVHFEGLSRLIRLKGGLETIEMPGLAALISFAGLRVGTQHLTMPRYPVVTLSCPAKDFIFQHRGVGFGTNQDLYTVLSMVNSYTIMIDDLLEGRKVVTASVLIDHRNTTQHALLSLQPRIGTSECYRLAALIYSLLVTFPLPYITAPFQSLVTQLKIALMGWDDDDQMLLWILAVGGIGATALPEREWFVVSFHKTVTSLGLRSWDEAREVIMRGLWFGATNDGDGSDLWLESQSVGLRNARLTV